MSLIGYKTQEADSEERSCAMQMRFTHVNKFPACSAAKLKRPIRHVLSLQSYQQSQVATATHEGT